MLGDPSAEVDRLLLAVDPVQAVADEAVEAGADMIICHHPLFLRGVHSMAATSSQGPTGALAGVIRDRSVHRSHQC
ncbi:MAG: Nif3-like dinuclear metal center hexameric protein [Marmoricola sp.]